MAMALFSPVFPIAGVGIHYGLDFSMSMDDQLKEQATLGDLKLDVSNFGTLPDGFGTDPLTGKDLPVYISRTGWENTKISFGGKVYIDILPVLDAVELSCNYGMWKYDGSIIYPTSIQFNASSATRDQDINNIATVNYDTTAVTIKGLNATPYAKLHFDLTVRKYLFEFPPVVKILKIYGGAGMSTFFATPILSAPFIEKAIGTSLNSVTDVTRLGTQVFDNTEIMKKLGEEFMKELFTPHMGGHVDLGAMIKIPLVPFGVFVDCKYLIPFGKMDENVDNLSGSGLLINSGILFAL
ncbi:MAG: hypothetical protein JXA71_05510 [Chitinispirillaceae bacterium]|nr:hypothetical protein [Chitinispirillaceae bacterium]